MFAELDYCHCISMYNNNNNKPCNPTFSIYMLLISSSSVDFFLTTNN